jgi:oxygen-dependent protoporphyrinogen oxidase
MTSDIAALAARARGVEVVVVGGGVAGLVAALEFAKVGMRVTVLEAAARPGGALRSQVLDGLALDSGAESFATRGGHVASLVSEVGLGPRLVSPAAGGAWVVGLPGGAAAPLPAGGVLGIPANPWDPAVRRVLGLRGTWRAYLDRLRPPLTIGHERSLGMLVRSRMGPAVLDRLVAPVTAGVYSAHPDDIDVEQAAPGLSAALTRTGSLSGAVSVLRAGADTPGSAVQGLDGGMAQLADALVQRLAERGAAMTTGAAVVALEAGAAGGWRVRTDDASYRADIVVVATGESQARRLLAPLLPDVDEDGDEGPDIEIVTLVVTAPALDAAPRGTGVLTVPGSHRAKALTHATAKWPWLARDAGPGRHVLRVSFGAQGQPPATADLDDEAAAILALQEATALLGVPLEAASLRAAGRARYRQSQPAAALGRRERVREVREAVTALPGIGVVGAWISGTGLAQVVPDAIEQAGLLRRGPLFSGAGRA